MPVAKACLQNDFIQEAYDTMKYSTNLRILFISWQQKKVILYYPSKEQLFTEVVEKIN